MKKAITAQETLDMVQKITKDRYHDLGTFDVCVFLCQKIADLQEENKKECEIATHYKSEWQKLELMRRKIEEAMNTETDQEAILRMEQEEAENFRT